MPEAQNDSLRPWLEVTASDDVLFSFASPTSARDYFVNEMDKWSWIGSTVRGPDLTPSVSLHRRYRVLLEYKQQLDVGHSENKVKEAIETYLSFSPALHDRSQTQRKVLEIAKHNKPEAFWTLVWLGLKSTSDLGSHLHAIQQLDFAFLAGIGNAAVIRSQVQEALAKQDDTTKAAASEVHRLRDEAALNLEDLQALRARAAKLLADAQVSIDMSVEALSGAKDALESGTVSTLQENSKNLEAKWKLLTATYDNQLALQAPSKYWKNKQVEHKKQSQILATAAVTSGLVGATALFFLFSAIFQELKANQIPSWGQVLSATVASVMVLWIIKTLVRLTMSHIHLALDAEERRTMILSYLAMSKLSDATPDERKGLLAAIFRPTGDGIVKDETPPLPIFELFKAGK